MITIHHQGDTKRIVDYQNQHDYFSLGHEYLFFFLYSPKSQMSIFPHRAFQSVLIRNPLPALLIMVFLCWSSYTWFVPIKWTKTGVEQQQYWLLQETGALTVTLIAFLQ